MAAGVKFQSFVTRMAAGTHANALNASTDTLRLYLTNTQPDVAADAYKADLPTETSGTGYSNLDANNTAATATGTITVGCSSNPVWTAGAADWTAARYVILYNDTPTSPSADPLVCYWDYGSSFTLANGETFTVNVTTNWFTVS